MKLGKLPHRRDVRTVQLVKYLDAEVLPPAPSSYKLANTPSAWGMFLNDQIGDCAIAAPLHMEMGWNAAEGISITPTDSDALSAYEAVSGYNPTDGSNDNGCVELDVLRYWRRHGIFDRKVGAYAIVDPHVTALVKDACYLFGGLYIGLALPESARDQIDSGQQWHVAGPLTGKYAPNSWGGHAVNIISYNRYGLTCVTWGQTQRMTWGFFHAYCVAPETRILTDDLRWIAAGDLVEGEGLLAFEEMSRPHAARRFERGVVESAPVIKRPCYDVTFEDGTTIRCSAEHRWLTHHHHGASWIETRNLRAGPKASSNVVKPLNVWSTETSYEAGYLAAAFDGEGHLSQRDLTVRGPGNGVANVSVGFTQRDNAMWARVQADLKEFGFAPNEHRPRLDGVRTLTLSRRADVLRLLGSLRPVRLLDLFRPELLGSLPYRTQKVVERRFVGEQEVVALKTSSGTYLAEGFASHNCDEAWAIISADFFAKTGKTPNGFDLKTLEADLAKIGRPTI